MSVANSDNGAPAAKRVLRDHARQRRSVRSAAERAHHGQLLANTSHPALDAAEVVTLFVGVGEEPDTLPLVERLTARGTRVLLPVVQPDLDLDWAAFTGADALERTKHGLLEPAGPRLGLDGIATADVVLVPALAVDGDGRRLGQGGGCYDRALRRVAPTVPVLAVVFPDEVTTDPLPDEPHDRRVDGALIPPG
jgi:5-formyltetrahydrofolate cyclo-ligase